MPQGQIECFVLQEQGLGRLRGLARRPLPLHLRAVDGGGEEALFRVGDAQHQQPQRAHPQEVVPRRPRLHQEVRPAPQERQRRRQAGRHPARHLRQGAEEAAR